MRFSVDFYGVCDSVCLMDPHVTVRPTPSGERFLVVEVRPDGAEVEHERDYGRLDAAASRAWTMAKKKRIPLKISIDPGRPHAAD